MDRFKASNHAIVIHVLRCTVKIHSTNNNQLARMHKVAMYSGQLIDVYSEILPFLSVYIPKYQRTVALLHTQLECEEISTK